MRGHIIQWAILPAFFVSLSFGYDWSTNPGDGSPENPYQISEPNQLIAIGSDPNLLDKHFILVNDIVFDPNNNPAHLFTRAVIAPRSVRYISNLCFNGSLDGDSHRITNLTCTGTYNLGLFGWIGPGGSVSHLVLQDVCITGGVYNGGLCGINEGHITDCSVTGDVTGSGEYIGGLCGENVEGIITNCHAIGRFNGDKFVGGLCGRNSGLVAESFAMGSVIGREGLGGLCGKNDWIIRDCHGEVNIEGVGSSWDLGGLCGSNQHMITRCYAAGSVSALGESGGSMGIGGLCGTNGGEITDCYSLGPVTGGLFFGMGGGLCGLNMQGTIRFCHAAGDVTCGETAWGGLCGYNVRGLIQYCQATGDVRGTIFGNDLGGLCGGNYEGTISYCYATGSVTAEGDFYVLGGLCGDNYSGAITDCYSTGEVIGEEDLGYLGGLCGLNVEGFIASSYFLNTAGPDNGYGEPLDDPNMKIRGNFVGWDFADDGNDGPNNFWWMCVDGVDYPRLSWEFGQGGDYACPDGVGMADLEALAFAWLTEGSDPDFNTAADGSGDGQINTDDFDILSANWLRGLPPTIRSSHVGGCGGFLETAESLILPAAEDPPRFTVTVQGAFILFEDPIEANCCIGGIELALSVEGNQILLEEHEIPKAHCLCICTYPATATLGPFVPGEYMFEVVQISEEGTGFIGQVPVVIE